MRTIISLLFLLSIAGNAAADIDALRDDANAAAAAGDTDKAIALFAQIIEEAPEDGAAHYRLGSMLMDNSGDLDAAAAHFERAGELKFQAIGVAFRLSRIYARTGREADALDQLESMADNGFGLPNMIEGQDDYASVSDEPRYAAAMETIRAARFPCEAGEKHHAFDFWIGEWDVHLANGALAGSNIIMPVERGCAMTEHWTSANGGTGMSINYLDQASNEWVQVWNAEGGSQIIIRGGLTDDGMAMEGYINYVSATERPHHSADCGHRCRADGFGSILNNRTTVVVPGCRGSKAFTPA